MGTVADSYISTANDIYDYLLEEYPDIIRSYRDILYSNPSNTKEIFMHTNYVGENDFFNSFFLKDGYTAAELVKQCIFYILYSKRAADTSYYEQLKASKKALRNDRKNCYNYVYEKRYESLGLFEEIIKEKVQLADEWFSKDKVAATYNVSAFPFFSYFSDNLKIKYVLNELTCFAYYYVCYEKSGNIEQKRYVPSAVLDSKMVSIMSNPRDLKSEREGDLLRFFVESEDAAGNPLKVYFEKEYLMRDGEELTEEALASLGKKAVMHTLLDSKDYEILSGIYSIINSFVYATKHINFYISELLVVMGWISVNDDPKNSNRKRKIADAYKSIEKIASLGLKTEKDQVQGAEKKIDKPFFYSIVFNELPNGDVSVSGILSENLLEDWKNNASRNIYLKADEYGVLSDGVDRLFLSELQRYRILSALNHPKWQQVIYYKDFLRKFDFPSRRKGVAVGRVRTFLQKAVDNHLLLDKWVDMKDYFIADFIPIELESTGLIE